MVIRSLRLSNFRNYESLDIDFSDGTNIIHGDNAQGKTNILEALYMIATTKSHRGVHDRDMIRFGEKEGHIRTVIIKNGIDYQVDMHLRSGAGKGIAINGQRIKRAAELIGLLHIVFFSPEDLTIVKNGPAHRRHFMDVELCQLDQSYLHNLSQYNKIVDQRNKLLRDIAYEPSLEITLDVWDGQLAEYGQKIIARRREFIGKLNEMIGGIHDGLSGGKEKLSIAYEPNVREDEIAQKLASSRERDKYLKSTSCGPHKDDFAFLCEMRKNTAAEDSGVPAQVIDLRRFGSQGQQRTCALSLKLSEIRLVTQLIGEEPVLMLDDVLSELDSGRQQYLLNSLGGIQTFITCTGLEEFVNNRFFIDKLYRVEEGVVAEDQ